MRISRYLALPFAMATLIGSSHTTATAQETNYMAPDEVAAAFRYALPTAFDSFRAACSTELAQDGFVELNAVRIREKFAVGADDAWPGAKRMLLNEIAKDSDPESMNLINQLPDEAMRPMVDGMIGTLVATEIKKENCLDIERALQILDPLPPENLSLLVGFLIDLDNRSEEAKLSESEAAD